MHVRLNQPNVISESIDGEVVIIALDTGTYYSAQGPAARAWDGLIGGHDLATVAADLRRTCAVEGVDVDAELEAFVASLRAEQLVVDDPGAPAGDPLPTPDGTVPWAPLALETYTDMQELILLDPVHEVEPSRGWPAAAPPDPGA